VSPKKRPKNPSSEALASLRHDTEPLRKGCTTFSLLPAALLLFLLIAAASELRYFLRCFCSASTH